MEPITRKRKGEIMEKKMWNQKMIDKIVYYGEIETEKMIGNAQRKAFGKKIYKHFEKQWEIDQRNRKNIVKISSGVKMNYKGGGIVIVKYQNKKWRAHWHDIRSAQKGENQAYELYIDKRCLMPLK